MLSCLANDLPRPILESLYVSYTRPVFEYASPVWHGSIKADVASALERLQASAARRVLRANLYTPKAVLCSAMALPSLEKRSNRNDFVLSAASKPTKPTNFKTDKLKTHSPSLERQE